MNNCFRFRTNFWRVLAGTLLCFLGVFGCLLAQEVTSGESASQKRDLYFFVIDRSRSILVNQLSGPIRRAMDEFLKKLPPGGEVRLALFSDEATVVDERWELDAGPSRARFLEYFSRNFRPWGETRLYDTVADVIELILPDVDRYRKIQVLILSDGDDSSSVRYKSWGDLEELAGSMIAVHQAAHIGYWTLGFEPKEKPGRNIEYFSVTHLNRVELVVPKPNVDFSARPLSAQPNEPVAFSLRDLGGPVSDVQWAFGDGGSSTNRMPIYRYAAPGLYDVSLQAKGPGGESSADKRGFIRIVEKVRLDAAFSWFPLKVRVGTPVRFQDESAGGADQWIWDFEGAGIRTNQNPVVIFKTAGSATVRLKIQKESVQASTEQVLEIADEPPDAAFEVSSEILQIGQDLSLKATRTEVGWKHSWIVGGTNHSEGVETVWNVDRIGAVSIVHRVEGLGGITQKETRVFVQNLSALSPGFDWSPLVPRVGQRVQFNDTSQGGGTMWKWEFPDGTTSLARTPSYVFNNSGVYSVRLTLSRGNDEAILEHEIRVEPPLPQAEFTIHPSSGVYVGDTVVFEPKVSDEKRTHEWRIEGAERLTGARVEWIVDRAGAIGVTHVVEGPGGEGVAELTFTAWKKPIPVFRVTPGQGRAPLKVTFDVESDDEFSLYMWDFGDGSTGTLKRATHVYEKAGAFKPILRIRDRHGNDFESVGDVELMVAAPWDPKVKWAGFLLLALLVAGVLYLKLRPDPLHGTLTWTVAGTPGTTNISGRSFNLRECNVPNWTPSKNYILKNRDGIWLYEGGNKTEVQLVSGKQFKCDGITFRYTTDIK